MSHVTYHWDLMQGGDEWRAMRCGLLTASAMDLVITPTLKVASNEKTRLHLYELVSQRASKFVEPEYESFDMQRGKVEEVYAKDLYAEHHAPIKDCGFVTNARHGFVLGFSPDGMVGDDGQVQVKSRIAKHQVKTIIEDEMPADYLIQVQTELLVSERAWADFISYSNGMPMFVKRIHPDEKVQSAIIAAAADFEEKAQAAMVTYLKNSRGLCVAERRDINMGDEIKPSTPAHDYRFAG